MSGQSKTPEKHLFSVSTFSLAGFVAFMLLVCSTLIHVQAQDRDRVVIRGPQGSEATQVREGVERYGPIQRSDTLWNIASRLRPHSSVTVQQTMIALVQANPSVFPHGNPNDMLVGYYLRIPSLQEIQMVNPEAAIRQIRQGEVLLEQQQAIVEERNQANRYLQEQTELLEQSRQETAEAIGQVRGQYEEEFIQLQAKLQASITNSESVFRENTELKQKLQDLEQLIASLNDVVVLNEEYEGEIRSLYELLDELKHEQELVRIKTEEKGMVEQLVEHPAALALLASVPALLMILLTTWLLRRKDSEVVSVASVVDKNLEDDFLDDNLSDEEVRDALDKELLGDFEGTDALLMDNPFDLADDDDRMELDALSDELLTRQEEKVESTMTVAKEQAEKEDEDFPLVDDLDLLELEEEEVITQTEQAEEASETIDIDPDSDALEEQLGQLEQDELDNLLSGLFDEEKSESEQEQEAIDETVETETKTEEVSLEEDKAIDADINIDDIEALLMETQAEEQESLQEELSALDNQDMSSDEIEALLSDVQEPSVDGNDEDDAEHDPFDPDMLLRQAEEATLAAHQQADAQETVSGDGNQDSQNEQDDEEIDIEQLLHEHHPVETAAVDLESEHDTEHEQKNEDQSQQEVELDGIEAIEQEQLDEFESVEPNEDSIDYGWSGEEENLEEQWQELELSTNEIEDESLFDKEEQEAAIEHIGFEPEELELSEQDTRIDFFDEQDDTPLPEGVSLLDESSEVPVQYENLSFQPLNQEQAFSLAKPFHEEQEEYGFELGSRQPREYKQWDYFADVDAKKQELEQELSQDNLSMRELHAETFSKREQRLARSVSEAEEQLMQALLDKQEKQTTLSVEDIADLPEQDEDDYVDDAHKLNADIREEEQQQLDIARFFIDEETWEEARDALQMPLASSDDTIRSAAQELLAKIPDDA